MDLTDAFSDDIASQPAPAKAGKITAADGHTYHKSATANAKTAPTSGVTKSADEQATEIKAKVTEEELDFITIVDVHWGKTGTMLSPAVGLEQYQIPVATFERLIKKPQVIRALEQRGVESKKSDITAEEIWRTSTLSPQQLLVANAMTDLLDQRSDKKKLQDFGISTARWNAWLRQPEFRDYVHARASSLVMSSLHEADLSLVDKVRSGDLKAIEYLHEYTGKFVRKSNISSDTAGFNAETARALIQSIIEIIVEEVDDPDLGGRIGDRIRGLITASNTANALTGALTGAATDASAPEIIVPEVAESRVITPEIAALMNNGVGMEQ